MFFREESMIEPIRTEPQIRTEVEERKFNVLLIGKNSFLWPNFLEFFRLYGFKINDSENIDYIFQLGNFEQTKELLEKAKTKGAKFFLVLTDEVEERLGKKAEKETLEFIKDHKIEAKIIKVFGRFLEERELVKKILKVAFNPSAPEIVEIKGPTAFLSFYSKPKKNFFQKNFFKKILFFFLFLFTLSFPLIFILLNSFLGLYNLKQIQKNFLTTNIEKSKLQTKIAQNYFLRAKTGFKIIAPIVLRNEELKLEIENWLEAGQDLSLALDYLFQAGEEGQKIISQIFEGKEGNLKEIISNFLSDVSLAEEKLALIEAKNQNPRYFKNDFEKIKKMRRLLSRLKNLGPLIPSILGIEEEKNYLVLFQNNFELRPGGGFIGSFGLFTLKNGKIDFKIEDVYTADGQLRGHVEPPKPIRDFLNQIHWYLRDSNWEADFPTNAQRASWFLEKELGIRTDGVISIDIYLAKKILEITGPIFLTDYQEKINAENLFLKAQVYSQKDFFPGSTQKKDFLGALGRAVFDKLMADKKVSWIGLAKALEESIQEKHFQFYLKNNLAQKIIIEQGLGGEVKNLICEIEEKNCLNDYLMVVEANLGVNKVNYFVKRKIEKRVEIKDNILLSKIALNYENTSPINVFFGGIYKNYLRILIPQEGILEEIKINGQKQDLEKNVVQEFAFEKKSIGFLVEIKEGEKKRIEISYRIPFNFASNDIIYQLLVQKQSGTDNDPFNLEIVSPWEVMVANFPFAKNNYLSYNGNLTTERFFKVKFKRGF